MSRSSHAHQAPQPTVFDRLVSGVLCFAIFVTAALVIAQNLYADLKIQPPQTLLDSRLISPAESWRQAQAYLREGASDDAYQAAQHGLAKAPGFSTGWILLGAAVEAQLGVPAALPYYDHALSIDKHGRKSVEFAAPRLYYYDWVSTKQIAWWAMRLHSRPLAMALPTTPPVDWPTFAAPYLPKAGLDALYAGGRDEWLLAVANSPFTELLSPQQWADVLAGLCRMARPECLVLAEHCESKADTCPQGANLTPALVQHISSYALAVTDLPVAEHWAKQGVAQLRDAGSVRQLIKVYRAQGNLEAARRLARLHPALNTSR